MYANPNHFDDKYHIRNILGFSGDDFTSIIRYSKLFGEDERILLSRWPDLLQLEMSETREFARRNRKTGKTEHINFFRFTGIRNTGGRRTRADGPLTSSEHGKYISKDPFTAEAEQDLFTFYNESKRDSRHFKFQRVRSKELYEYVQSKKVEEHRDYLQALYDEDPEVVGVHSSSDAASSASSMCGDQSTTDDCGIVEDAFLKLSTKNQSRVLINIIKKLMDTKKNDSMCKVFTLTQYCHCQIADNTYNTCVIIQSPKILFVKQ